MRKSLFFLALVILVAWGVYSLLPKEINTKIRVSEPIPNEIVTSPLVITGEAVGPWFFKASFPIKVYDTNEKLLGQSFAQAKDEWMTEDFVPFEATIEFVTGGATEGTIVFEKQNASGLPEHADDYKIPVRFERQEIVEFRTIILYYYNPELDKDESGNILCNGGLAPVERQLQITTTPIQDTIHLLLKGELTAEEVASGITTEYPLEGFNLSGVNLENGQLTLSFEDPNYKTSGGSCRVNILRNQIEQTALQFEEVNSVVIKPEYLFQP